MRLVNGSVPNEGRMEVFVTLSGVQSVITAGEIMMPELRADSLATVHQVGINHICLMTCTMTWSLSWCMYIIYKRWLGHTVKNE